MQNNKLFRLLGISACSFLIGALTISCDDTTDSFDYTLDWEGDRIAVDLKFNPGELDTIRLSYGNPGAGGMTDIATWLQDIEVAGANFHVDSVGDVVLTIYDFQDNKPVNVRYKVKCTLPEDYAPKGTCLMDMFRPDITDDMLYVNGFNLFMLPDAAATDKVTVRWNSVPDYPVFCLYNPGQATAPYSGKLTDINGTVIVGDPLLTVDTLNIDGVDNYIVTAVRKDSEYNRGALRKYFSTVYPKMRSFWDDTASVSYSLIVFPFRNNTFETSGNGFANGFLARYNSEADTIFTDSRAELFTHEIGHKWISSDAYHRWFGEGFNDLQTAYMLVECGVLPPSHFVDYLNRYFVNLYNSNLKNIDNKTAAEDFWNSHDNTWIPYWRGMIYGFYLTGLVEAQTGSAYGYVDMMTALKTVKDSLNRNNFIAALSPLIDESRLSADFDRYITNGEDVHFNDSELPAGLKMVYNDGVPQLSIIDEELFGSHWHRD